MAACVSAVLFDADGVIQRPSQDWWARLTSLVPAGSDAFVADLMAAEKPSLVGKGDFRDAVAEVLRRWNSPASVEEALEPWHWFAAEPAVVVADRHAAGGRDRVPPRDQPAGLPAGDHAGRARVRRLVRPDLLLVRSRAGQAGSGVLPGHPRPLCSVPASSVLFIDDNEANVAGALSVGLHAEVYDLSSGVDALVELLRRYGLPIPD